MMLGTMLFSAEAEAYPSTYFEGDEEYMLDVPEILMDAIKKKFGEYRLVTKEDYCPDFRKHHDRIVNHKIWSYGSIAYDFDQDGELDYSLIIQTESLRYVWILAMKTSEFARGYLLTDMGTPSIRHFNHTSFQFQGKLCEGAMVVDPISVEDYMNIPVKLGIEAHGKSLKVFWQNGELFEVDDRQTEYVPWYYGENL